VPAPAEAQAPLPASGGAAAQAAPSSDGAFAAYQRALATWRERAQQVAAIAASNLAKQQQFEAAVALIKQDGTHGFRIDIETDSTIAPDEQAEKQSRVELLAQMVPLLEQVIPLARGNPALASVCREIALFAARGFRVARTLEETLERAFDTLAQAPSDAPDAERSTSSDAAELALRAHAIDAKTQIERDKNAIAAAKAAGDHQLEQIRLVSQTAADKARLAMEAERLATEKASLILRTDALAARQAQELT
jgi:hypothetical protein